MCVCVGGGLKAAPKSNYKFDIEPTWIFQVGHKGTGLGGGGGRTRPQAAILLRIGPRQCIQLLVFFLRFRNFYAVKAKNARSEKDFSDNIWRPSKAS